MTHPRMSSKSRGTTRTIRSPGTRNALISAALAMALLGGYQVWRFYATPPRLEATDEAVKTLDALFTALTARDSVGLSACRKRIEQYASEKKLSSRAVAESLYCDQLARQGAWEQAAKRLYWMIYEQP